MDYAKQIKELNDTLASLNDEKIRVETNLEAVKKQRSELEKEMKEANVTPDTIEKTIKKLEEEIAFECTKLLGTVDKIKAELEEIHE